MSFVAQKRQRVSGKDFLVLSLVLAGWAVVTVCLLVIAWKRATGEGHSENVAQAAAQYPMSLSPLIAGKSSGTAGEIVYLTEVVLKAGPGSKMFFLTGKQGTQILTVADGAHLLAVPGETVDVKGTIRNTPPVDVLRREWKLNRTEATQVSQLPIYIESNSIRKSGD